MSPYLFLLFQQFIDACLLYLVKVDITSFWNKMRIYKHASWQLWVIIDLHQFSSVTQSCPTLCKPMNRSTPGLPVHHQLPESTQTHVHCVSDAIQPSSSIVPFSSCPQSFPASGSFQMSKLSTSDGQSIGVSASTSVLSMNTQDWSDLLAVQGSLKSLLQHHSSKASILQCSAFFIVQLSHPHMTTGKTIALTRWTFYGKVMSLLFNMLSRLVITFLPRSKRLLISWLQSPSTVILEPRKIKSATVSPSICHEVMGHQGVSWDMGFFSANMEMFVCLEQIGVLSHSTWGNECFPPPKAFLFWSCQKWLRPMPISEPTNNCFWKLSLRSVPN